MQGESFKTFRFSAYEVIAAMVSLATMAVGITLWSISTFQTKEEYRERQLVVERRLDILESQMRAMNDTISGVARDVSYIRGKIETK
jgi:hypothetical protein